MERQTKIDLFARIKTELSTARNIAVLCHAYSDGDCLGSALALKSAIERTFSYQLSSVVAIAEEPVSQKYLFLPGVSDMYVWPEGRGKYDVIITVDTASVQLLGQRSELLSGAYVISLDHHSSCVPYADLDIREPEYGACGELVYEFVTYLCGDLTDNEALCLFTAISSDTGGLSQRNTTSNSMAISAKLMEYPSVNVDDISFRLFKASSFSRNQVLGFCLLNEKRYADGKICTAYITNKLLEDTGCTEGETEGIVNAIFATDGCEIAILAKETSSGVTKCSLRSKSFDVAFVANHFNGGGHKNAAGCRLLCDAETAADTVARFILDNGII